ncbi:MAG: tetratricopeptide repeat protein [Acidobacteriota bacterium]|nr:tetratricopeptide repeat protein [Acidobacteriota bacterium]
MLVIRVVLVALAVSGPAFASASGGQTAATVDDPKARAFYEFLMARRLEAAGDSAGSMAALQRAQELDPNSAEIAAEMAGAHARQDQAQSAILQAERALKLDAGNVEAHFVLAQLYAEWAEGTPPPAGETAAGARDKAIEHLVAIQKSPVMAVDPNLQMTLGRLQLRAGRTADALPILERVAAQAPWAAEPLVLLYEAYANSSRFDEAEKALIGAAEINPRFWAQLGQFYERRNQWAAAAGAYDEALKRTRQPSRDLQLRLVAALLNVEDGAPRARAVLADLLKANPNDVRALYLMSSVERAGGDMKAAEAAARKIMAADPASVTGLYALVQILFDRYDFKQVVEVVAPFAREPVSRSKGREMEGAAVLVQLGIAQQQLAQWDASIAAFMSAKALTPRDPEIDAYLVQAHIAARRFDRAETLARENLARNPEQPRMIRLRAQALNKGGKPAEALQLMEAGAAKNPASREYVVGLADLYTDQKRAVDAVRMLEQARKTFGDDEVLTMRMATAYEVGGKLAEAEQELRRLMAEDPLNANALNSLSYLLADRGLRLPEAVALAERALTIEPDNPSYLDTLGWALFKQGKADEADVPLARAAATLTGNSVIQDHHGDVLARRGRHAEAVAAWERALAGDGEQIDRGAIEKKIKAARAKGR